MNIGEGEECWLDDDDEDDVFSQVIASLHCKKGLACVPKVEGIDDYNHVCKKSYTSIDDLKYCSSSNGCPYDSICECNDIIGKSVCVPIVVSSKKLKKLYDKLVENEDEENYDPYIDMVDYLKDNYLRHDSKFRCDAYLKDAASVLKASVFVTIALAFLALF